MKNRILCFLLVCALCVSSIAFVAMAAEGPEEYEQSEQPDVTETPLATETPEPEPTEDWSNGVVPLPIDVPPDDTDEPTDTPEPRISTEPTDEPTPTATSTEEPSATLDVQISGNGTLEVYKEGGWSPVHTGSQAVQFTIDTALDFRAIGSNTNVLSSVTLNNDNVTFSTDSTLTNAWRFSLRNPADGDALAVTFSDNLPVDIAVEGPGTISVYENNAWKQVSPGLNALSAPLSGGTLTLAADATQDSYACTSIKINNQTISPKAYGAAGAIFEVTATSPRCDVEVEFTRSDQLIVDLDGQGKVYLAKGQYLIELQDEARLPFSAQDTPLRFTLTPDTGYTMGTVTFQNGALTVTQDSATQECYSCTLVSPVNGGILKASFLASDDSLIQWIRGTDTTTGISWAVPLGTSIYGTSNATANSRMLITRLTQGTSYDAARTAATPYSQFAAWDFTLVDQNGQAFTPTVPVLMNLPIPSGYPTTVPPLRMLHILSNGSVVENTIETRTNPQTGTPYLFMRAESLSTFVLVNTNSSTTNTGTATPAPTSQGGTTNTSGTGGGTTQTNTAPHTGDSTNLPMWWTLMVLCVVMIGISGFELGRLSN